MCNRWPGILGIVMGFLFIFCGIAWAADIRIEIDPATGKPVVKSDVPVVSTETTNTGWMVLTLSTGERVGYYVDPGTGDISVQVFSGTVNVMAGNVRASMESGEAAAIKVNRETGTVQIAAQSGVIDVSARGRRVRIKPGQQAVARRDAPPALVSPAVMPPPTPAPAPPTAMPHVPALPTPPAPPPTPPEYQVNPDVPPPPIAEGMQVEEFHGQQPTSPAE